MPLIVFSHHFSLCRLISSSVFIYSCAVYSFTPLLGTFWRNSSAVKENKGADYNCYFSLSFSVCLYFSFSLSSTSYDVSFFWMDVKHFFENIGRKCTKKKLLKMCHTATCNFFSFLPLQIHSPWMTLTSCKYMWPFRSHNYPLDFNFFPTLLWIDVHCYLRPPPFSLPLPSAPLPPSPVTLLFFFVCLFAELS